MSIIDFETVEIDPTADPSSRNAVGSQSVYQWNQRERVSPPHSRRTSEGLHATLAGVPNITGDPSLMLKRRVDMDAPKDLRQDALCHGKRVLDGKWIDSFVSGYETSHFLPGRSFAMSKPSVSASAGPTVKPDRPTVRITSNSTKVFVSCSTTLSASGTSPGKTLASALAQSFRASSLVRLSSQGRRFRAQSGLLTGSRSANPRFIVRASKEQSSATSWSIVHV